MVGMPATQLTDEELRPAARLRIMGYLVRSHLQAPGIGQRPGREATS
jgi:hypothetical protein